MSDLSVKVQPTMSSLEIAELVEARHDSVKRAIERLANRAVITLPPMVEKPTAGRPVSAYLFSGDQGKRDSTIVVAQLSPEFTARLVDRWQELEALNSAASLPDFSNPVAAARAWADAREAEQKALEAAEAARPAVEFVDQYVAADSGSKGFRQVAKLLNANERDFRDFLRDHHVMYRLGGEWMPYQNHIDAGRFVVKTGVANEHAYNAAKFTAKGVNWIAGLWAQRNMQGAA
ncbi:phage antirepressor KilAC domain-containing protein [Halomonas aquamarina]|uniref:Phage antirepressor KilAC domain-containing protein n=1 Tax=Vreelandella aquamarina TaxID=77097 RepID=A0ACC5VT80_9GAMM|nr:phage antirepressor KilAC domain-containing protein [Halomonas aquamarina]MBZ5486934.1 phage antirepressor KilAC domain-containing protein [Halomonas aquamarina]